MINDSAVCHRTATEKSAQKILRYNKHSISRKQPNDECRIHYADEHNASAAKKKRSIKEAVTATAIIAQFLQRL